MPLHQIIAIPTQEKMPMKCRNDSMKHVIRHAPANLRFPLPLERGSRLPLLELSDDFGLEARSLYGRGRRDSAQWVPTTIPISGIK